MPRLLLIDDGERLGPPLAAYFARAGFELQHATRPSAGLALLRGESFDAAILDVMLPEMDGFELCRTIRKDSSLPIVMLTACGDVMDRIVGLELGADDYLPKPFEPRKLLARIQTVLRRAVPAPANAPEAARALRFEGITIDLDRRSVLANGQAVELTAVFLFGMQRVLQGGWQGYAKPLVADCVDKPAAGIGSPPDEARARAIVARLPVPVVANSSIAGVTTYGAPGS